MGYKVLILEDNKVDAYLMKDYLQRSKEPFADIHLVYDKDSYKKSLQALEADLIISDYRLNNFNGMEALKLKNAYNEDIPFLIVSAHIGEEKAVELIREGAVDFLIKNNMEKRLAQVAIRAIEESLEKKKRRQAEFSLRQSEQRYRMLFDSSRDAILIGLPDNDGQIMDANPAACRLLGYTLTELKRLSRKDLMDKEDSKIWDFLNNNEDMTNFRRESELVHKNCFTIPVEISSRIIELPDGAKRCYSMLRDIRERKQAEKQLEWDRRIQKLHRDIAQIINQNIDFAQSFEACIKCICKFLDWPLGHIYIRNIEGHKEYYESLNVWHLSEQNRYKEFIEAASNTIFQPEEGLIGKVAKSYEPVLFNPLKEHETYIRNKDSKSTQLKTGLIYPIIIENRVEAVMEFYSDTKDDFDQQRKDVLEAVSIQLGRLIERKRHLETLEGEKERYQLIAENSTDMISRQSPEGDYIYVSPACKQLTGFSPDEMVGSSAYEYIHPDDSEKIQEVHQNLLNNPGVKTFSYRIKQKKGDWRWVETISKTIRNPDTNEVFEIQGATRDISDRKMYEQELKRQLKLNENIINSLPELFFIISEDQTLQRVNDQFRGKLGYENVDISKMHPTDFVADEDKESALSSIKKAFAEKSVEVELRLQTKSGETIPYLMSGSVRELEGEKYLLGTGINILKRIEAEKELKQHEQLLQSVMDQASAAIYIKDETGNFLFANKEFRNITGLKEEKIVGERDTDLIQILKAIDKGDVENMLGIGRESLKKGKPIETETTFSIEGEKRTFLTSKIPLKNISGFENTICSILTEITDRKKAEERLKESLHEKEVLLLEIHHRVKNNLAIISSLLQLEAYESNNEEVVMELTNSQSRIQSIAIIHELLYHSNNFSQIKVSENIAKLIEHISSSIKTNSRIETELNIIGDIKLNINQAIPFTLILNELLTNIYKHAFNGRENGTIKCDFKKEKAWVHFKISDDGIGLPDNFDPGNSESVGFKIIYILTQQLEGELSYRSKRGEGTEFVLSFESKVTKGSSGNIITNGNYST